MTDTPDPDYETPRTPPTTPPTIDPNVKSKTAAEMEDEGETEGEVLGHRSDPDEIDTELSDKLVERDKRDGIGEPTIIIEKRNLIHTNCKAQFLTTYQRGSFTVKLATVGT